jgi:hypothetical protein
LSKADNSRTKIRRIAGRFDFAQPLLRSCGWFGFFGVKFDDKSASAQKKEPVIAPSSLLPYQSCPLDMYPISKQVPNQPGIAMPERTKRFLTERGFEYELEDSRGMKRNNLENCMDVKGYWAAIADQQEAGSAVAYF